jgi:hypothetical protein
MWFLTHLNGRSPRQAGPLDLGRARLRVFRPQLEQLEDRNLPSGLTLGPLVQVSGPSPFAGSTADYDQPGPVILNREAENSAAVNPTNLHNIVDVWRQDQWPIGTGGGPRGIAAGVTLDGGASWQEVVIPGLTLVSGGHFQYASDPWVSFGPDGTAYVISLVWDRTGPGFAGDLDVNISRDGGLTWGAPITVFHDFDAIDFLDKPSITADPTDARLVYAVWDRFESPDGIGHRPITDFLGHKAPALFSRSTDGGQTWEPPHTLYDPGANNGTFNNQVLVLPDGTPVAFFDEFLGFKNSDGGAKFEANLGLLRSPDKGQTWLPHGQPIRAAKIQAGPTTDPDTGQRLRANNFVFSVAVDRTSGNLCAVWQDARFSNFQSNGIAFAMSADGGFTWSAPVKINQTPTNIPAADQQAFEPSIAVAADGSVAVTYYDFRHNTAAPGTLTDYWLIHASANTDLTNPANWEEVRLTDTSFDVQKAALSAADGNAEFLGDYQSLVAMGNSFGAFFSMTHDDDGGSIFFRDPPPAEPAAAGPSAAAPDYMGDYDTAADNGFFYTTWGDNRLGDAFHAHQPDVRLAKIPVTGPPMSSVRFTSTSPGRAVAGPSNPASIRFAEHAITRGFEASSAGDLRAEFAALLSTRRPALLASPGQPAIPTPTPPTNAVEFPAPGPVKPSADRTVAVIAQANHRLAASKTPRDREWSGLVDIGLLGELDLPL